MEQLDSQTWAVMHFGLIFLITCAQMVVVYALSGASEPTPGLGLYTVYFMASLLAWIAYILQQGADIPMALDVPSVASILNSYILFLAVGQRAEATRGRLVLGIICLLACLSVFFLPQERMFVVQCAVTATFYAGVGVLCATRSWQKQNVGDAITATAAALVTIGTPFAMYQWLFQDAQAQARAVTFGINSSAYALVVIGFLASVLIEYQRHLSHLATRDPLTRLLNRRGLEGALQITLAQSARQQLATSSIMLDMDHFHDVNENFGPDVGDQIIRQIAQVLTRMSRTSDVVARTGGEKFLMILPNTALNEARILAERIRAAIGERPLMVHGQHIAVTASLGVAGVVGEVDLDKLSGEANRALQLAKQGGRNQIASVESKPIHLSTTAREA